MITMNHRYSGWWRTLVKKRGITLFGAAPTPAVRATEVTHTFSCPFRRGVRTYAFYTEEDLGTFLTTFADKGAIKVQNPLAIDRQSR